MNNYCSRSLIASSSKLIVSAQSPSLCAGIHSPSASLSSSSSPFGLTSHLAHPVLRLSPLLRTLPSFTQTRLFSQSLHPRASPQLRVNHTLHVHSTRNNVILTFEERYMENNEWKSKPAFASISGGTDKDFKKSNRSGFEAAHQAAIKMFSKIAEHMSTRDGNISVAFKGMFGKGREAVAAALLGPEGAAIKGKVMQVEDRTPIKIGGTRPKKARRL